MTIKIAVAGHTNAGKTTFITTLMRMKVGKIGDVANVTTEGASHKYEGLQAIFIDTPGFQNPSLAFTYLKGTELDQEDMESLKYDLKAIEAIKQGDIVIYLGNLSGVPDDSDIREIKIVKKIQPKVVAVLNQYQNNLQSGGKEKVENRIRQWTKVFNQNGIDDVIIFDAHWDKRSKEKIIYDAIEKNLDYSQKNDFYAGLNKFKKRQNEIQEEICGALARTCENLQKIKVSTTKGEYDSDEATRKKSQDDSQKLVLNEISKFITYTEKLYKVAAERPNDSLVELKKDKKMSVAERLGTTTGVSTVLGTIGAFVGALGGGLIAALLTGGVGALGGAVHGAQIGAIAGTGLGSLVIFSDIGDLLSLTLESKSIESIIKQCLAIAWGFDHNGFGRGKTLSTKEAKEIKTQIDHLFAQEKIDDWTKINQMKVINYCQNILQELDRD